jgi:hypothetical protein
MTKVLSLSRAALPLASVALAVLGLGGCATPADAPAGYTPSPAAANTPPTAQQAPTGALRCMDDLLLDHGVRDLTVVAEDLADPARKATVSKDLLIAAVSDMSRRSRTIRISAQGADSTPSPQAVRPQYLLRGSLSRPDERTLGVDLTLMTTQDGSAVPGVASRRQAAAAPGDAALRPLVEGAAVELFGRLAKVPYWTCLGQPADDPAVVAEVRDWYDAMAARPKEIIEFFQAQLRHRGAYDGPIDGAVNERFNDAVARYRGALGLSRAPRLSQDFLAAWLSANHRELKAQVAAAPPAPAAAPVSAPATAPIVASSPPVQPVASVSSPTPSPAPPPAASPLAVRVSAANDARVFERDEVIQLTVRPTRDAHVYCFLQDEQRRISRFFPNRFQRDSRVEGGIGLQLPGSMRFEIRMNGKGVAETVACYATERDVLPELPATLAASDFAPLPVASLDQLRDAFTRAARGKLAQAALEVRPK